MAIHQKYVFLEKRMVINQLPFLLCGELNVGKSWQTQDQKIARGFPDTFVQVFIHCGQCLITDVDIFFYLYIMISIHNVYWIGCVEYQNHN